MPGTKTVGSRILIGVILCAAVGEAQDPGPHPLILPPSRRDRAGIPSADPNRKFDPVFAYGYGNRREAAVAALLAGNDREGRPDIATGLYLLSIQRDPTYARALYNLGVMSTRAEKWTDAMQFYQQARALDTANEIGSLIEAELVRVAVVDRLMKSPDGARQRNYDIQLSDAIAKFNDPVVAVEAAVRLTKADSSRSDPSRWEGYAAAGIMQAALQKYEDSAKSFDAAIRLAPPEWRPKLQTAGDLARQEGQYTSLAQQGDAALEKKQYESAARFYADAWQASPARVETGLRSAIAFLMADQVSLAVQTLSRLKQVGSTEISAKAGLMLTELGAISPDAKAAAVLPRSGETEQLIDVPSRIRTALGDIRSADVKTAAAPNPPLIGDPLKFIQVNDDQLNNPTPYTAFSSQTLFSSYLSAVGGAPVSPAPAPQFPAAPEGAPAPRAVAAPGLQPPPDAASQSVLPQRPPRLDSNRPAGFTPPPGEVKAGEAKPGETKPGDTKTPTPDAAKPTAPPKPLGQVPPVV